MEFKSKPTTDARYLRFHFQSPYDHLCHDHHQCDQHANQQHGKQQADRQQGVFQLGQATNSKSRGGQYFLIVIVLVMILMTMKISQMLETVMTINIAEFEHFYSVEENNYLTRCGKRIKKRGDLITLLLAAGFVTEAERNG